MMGRWSEDSWVLVVSPGWEVDRLVGLRLGLQTRSPWSLRPACCLWHHWGASAKGCRVRSGHQGWWHPSAGERSDGGDVSSCAAASWGYVQVGDEDSVNFDGEGLEVGVGPGVRGLLKVESRGKQVRLRLFLPCLNALVWSILCRVWRCSCLV